MENGSSIKRQHSSEFKVNVVLELLKQEETLSQICSRFSIHPTQARRWKETALAVLRNGFDGQNVNRDLKARDILIEELYRQIGQLKVELDWLKKKWGGVR